MSKARTQVELEVLEGWISRYQELKSVYQEYCQLGKLIKQALRGKHRLMVGDYLVSGQWVVRRAHTVPETRYWQMRIEQIDKE